MNIKEVFKLTWLPVIGASLCCLSPIIMLLLGFGGVAFASSLADTLYGEYKWWFRVCGLLLLIIAIILHFRKKGVCTLDQAKRHRREIINTTLLAIFIGVIGYVFFLYVVVHYWGVWLDLWV